MNLTCVLSGLEIPPGKENQEHLCPKSRVPKTVWSDPRNIFWAHRVMNTIKGNFMPCEWERAKFDLTYHALQKWNLHKTDKQFLKRALEYWDGWHMDACGLCLLKCKERQK